MVLSRVTVGKWRFKSASTYGILSARRAPSADSEDEDDPGRQCQMASRLSAASHGRGMRGACACGEEARLPFQHYMFGYARARARRRPRESADVLSAEPHHLARRLVPVGAERPARRDRRQPASLLHLGGLLHRLGPQLPQLEDGGRVAQLVWR